MTVKMLVLEQGSSWGKSIQIVFGSVFQITVHSDKNSESKLTTEPAAFDFVAVEYHKETLTDFFSLFDKTPSKLENLNWILLGAPKNGQILSLLREFGFSFFVSDLPALIALKNNIEQLMATSSIDASRRDFEHEMFQRIPLE